MTNEQMDVLFTRREPSDEQAKRCESVLDAAILASGATLGIAVKFGLMPPDNRVSQCDFDHVAGTLHDLARVINDVTPQCEQKDEAIRSVWLAWAIAQGHIHSPQGERINTLLNDANMLACAAIMMVPRVD